MAATENKALVRRYIEEVWNERRLDRIDEFIADDIILHESPEIVGRENVTQQIVRIQSMFADLVQTIEDEIAERDNVVHRWSNRATHQDELLGVPATGREVTFAGMSIFRLAGGKIAELWVQTDLVGLMQQIGALPVPAAS
jgi:steroid delta-isomerase-like uncharacterized protein